MSRFDFHIKNWKGFSEIPPKTRILLLFLVGLLLLVIAIPTKKSDLTNNVTESLSLEENETTQGTSDLMDASDYSEYEKILETRIEDTLTEVEGVGKVSVMITLKSSAEEVLEKDTTSETNQTDETTQSSSSRTSIYAQNSDGSQTPYVKKIYTPTIEGVIVIADGGDNSVVVQNISESIQALFGVEAHKIKIMKRSTS